VFDVSSERELALKQLSEGAAETTARLFELEYRTLASLNHPRVVEVYDFGRHEGSSFYTMELLRGEELSRLAPMPWPEVCAALRDVAEALGLLHLRGLVHRDVSPRNLWRGLDGRVKLIDFGALCPVGAIDKLIGTPPLIAPEALEARVVDARSDLYSLGAVAYFLLTGVHAFPARDVQELPARWNVVPSAPSRLVAELVRELPPAELDVLVMTMLSRDPLARPVSCGEVIDRLDMMVGAPRPSQRELAEHPLANGAFIGRQRERRRMRRLLLLASEGRGQSCAIAGESGVGRTRLLHEFAAGARIARATVLQADAIQMREHYGVVISLALKLLEAQPTLAFDAAQPHADLLAHLSPRLRERLRTTPRKDTSGELRVRLHRAICDWFVAVSQQHTLVLLVDGCEMLDEGSAAVLLALSHALHGSHMLLTCAFETPGRELIGTERALIESARTLRLGPLAERETHDLLRSLFGPVERLARLTSQLHRAAHGNPGHLHALCEQLMRRGLVSFRGGSWHFPQEVPDALLSVSRDEVLATRLARVTPAAQRLAALLSVHTGALAQPLLEALAVCAGESLLGSLPELTEQEILVRGEDGHRFTRESLRVHLQAGLTADARKRARRALGSYLASQPELGALDRIVAGVHLLDGEDAGGADLVIDGARQVVFREPEMVAHVLPNVEEALSLLRSRGWSDQRLVFLLGLLSTASYYASLRYTRHGEATIAALGSLLELPLARRLRRALGPKLALRSALALAAGKLARRKGDRAAPTLHEAIQLYVAAVGSLVGAHVVCVDPDPAERYTEALEPLTGLGEGHVATFIYRYCCVVSTSVRDRHSESYPRFQRMIAQLEARGPVTGFSERLQKRILGGALYASGMAEAHMDGPRALQTADRLEQLGAWIATLTSHQVRMAYYASQGDLKQAEHHRAEAERYAIQQGTLWQVDTGGKTLFVGLSLRLHDALGIKRCEEQLAAYREHVPSLAHYARRAHGGYLLLRERYREALPWLEGCLADPPRQYIGWGRAHGTLARAYNRLGEFEKARAACQRVLDEFDEGDFAFSGLNLPVLTEHVVALAGLGHVDRAKMELAALVARHQADGGPLTLGLLHETAVEIGLMLGDAPYARAAWEAMHRWYAGTGVPSLVQRCEVLRARVLALREGADEASCDVALAEDREEGEAASIARLLATSSSLEARALGILRLVAELADAHDGFALVWREGELHWAAALGIDQPSEELFAWAEARARRELSDDVTVALDELAPSDDASSFTVGDRSYGALPLHVPGGGAVGLLVLSSERQGQVPAHVVRLAARALQRALREQREPT
jgi:tetratricopeptide (TPR) repeat protein